MHTGRQAGDSRPAGANPTQTRRMPQAALAAASATVGIIDRDSPPAPPAVTRRLGNLGRRMVRTLVNTASVIGTATLALWSAEAAHDLATGGIDNHRMRPEWITR